MVYIEKKTASDIAETLNESNDFQAWACRGAALCHLFSTDNDFLSKLIKVTLASKNSFGPLNHLSFKSNAEKTLFKASLQSYLGTLKTQFSLHSLLLFGVNKEAGLFHDSLAVMFDKLEIESMLGAPCLPRLNFHQSHPQEVVRQAKALFLNQEALAIKQSEVLKSNKLAPQFLRLAVVGLFVFFNSNVDVGQIMLLKLFAFSFLLVLLEYTLSKLYLKFKQASHEALSHEIKIPHAKNTPLQEEAEELLPAAVTEIVPHRSVERRNLLLANEQNHEEELPRFLIVRPKVKTRPAHTCQLFKPEGIQPTASIDGEPKCIDGKVYRRILSGKRTTVDSFLHVPDATLQSVEALGKAAANQFSLVFEHPHFIEQKRGQNGLKKVKQKTYPYVVKVTKAPNHARLPIFFEKRDKDGNNLYITADACCFK